MKTGGIRNWRKISTSSTGSFTDDSNPEEVVVAVKMLLGKLRNSTSEESNDQVICAFILY